MKGLLEEYKVPVDIRQEIMRRYIIESKIIQIQAKGVMINFYWPNSELKAVTLMDNYLITDQSYWLQFYPFIDVKIEKNIMVATINQEFEKKTRAENLNRNEVTIISHNNHFGHFLFDDYPRLLIDELQFPSHIHRSMESLNLSKGIEDLLVSTIPSISSSSPKTEKDHSLKYSENVLQSFITNPFLNSYIIERKFERIRQLTKGANNTHDKIYIARDGQYESRIANQEEIKVLLDNEGFIMIDPSKYTTIGLIEKLSKASIIVTESGTSCLVASLYSTKSTTVIALVPEELLSNPSEDMVISGLPYHFATPTKIRLVLGKSIDNHVIQTSKKCVYSAKKITVEIKKALGKVLKTN